MKNRLTPTVGSIVRSKAGRDEGRCFLVLTLDGDEYALIADGDLRTVERPKRKKFRHLYVVQPESGLKQALEAGEAVTNGAIRESLAQAQCSEEG